MPENRKGGRSFLSGVLQSIGGSLVLSIVGAIWDKLKHGSVDWLAIAGLFIIACVVIFLLFYSFRGEPLASHKATGDNLTEKIEEAIKKALASQEPAVISDAVSLSAQEGPTKKNEVFDGDIQLIASAPKNPFAEQTKEVMQLMGKGDDFALDTDVVVKMFIVNTSKEKQYIRDISGTVEINGRQIEMVRQTNFDAFELNGTVYEYCLDPSPDEPHLLLEHRAQSLQLIAPSFPVEMEPRKAIDGWVRFLLKTVDYQKLDKNFTYTFTVEDSLSEHHPITRASEKKVIGKVGVRKRTQQ
jgi:hypothetical protein